jgi:homoserine kinase
LTMPSPHFRELYLRVPATTANMGSGYDLLGMALNLYNTLRFKPSDRYEMRLQGPYAQSGFKLTPRSLLWQGVERVYAEMAEPMPCFSVEQTVQIPPARGLGSSSSAIVAGLYAANLWCGEPFSREQLLTFATEIEGHPDNVAPALLGGAVLNFPHEKTPFIKIDPPPQLHWGVCIPHFELKTHAARAVIPAQVPLADAIANMSYLGALLTGFYTHNVQLIAQGLQDRLHQPYRQSLVPGMQSVMDTARAAGALGCVLSGAGPSLLVVSEQPLPAIAEKMCENWKKHEINADFVTCLIDPQGVVCLD